MILLLCLIAACAPAVLVFSLPAISITSNPPEGITRAVTAVAIPGSAGNVEIRLIDPMRRETLTAGGKREVPAGDFTVPFTALLEKNWTAQLLRPHLAGPPEIGSRARLRVEGTLRP